MDKKPYPVMVNMNQMLACVVGGGKVARRKVERLLDSGAIVTVISPELSTEMLSLYEEKVFDWINRTFQPEDLKDAFIIIAATNCKSTNELVANSSLPNQLVNIAHDKDLGNFHVPASFSQGKLTMSIGTSGASPMLAKQIKNELKEKYDTEYIGYLEFLETARNKIHSMDTIEHVEKIQLLNDIADRKYIKLEMQQTLLLFLHILATTEFISQ